MKKKHWESRYIEKNYDESHIYTFKSLEIKQYIRKYLIDYGFILHEFKFYFSNSVLNLVISIYETERGFVIKEQKKLERLKKLKKYHKKLYDNILLKKNQIKKLIKIKEFVYKNYKKRVEIKNLKKNIGQLKINKLIKDYYKYKQLSKTNIEKQIEVLKKINTFSKLNLLHSLNIFTNYKLPINLKIKLINNVEHTNNIMNNSSQPNSQELVLLKLRKFNKASFFKEGKHLIIPLTNQQNSASLLTTFIATQLRTIKQHNYFFNYLKESLYLTINNQKFSKIQGVKILIKGRLNNSTRSKHRIIKLGKVPLLTIKSKIDYAKSTAFTSNGTFGIKVWVCEKKKIYNVFTTKENKI